ncbi:hypothetical protein D3C80_1526330 [compost metagenome]
MLPFQQLHPANRAQLDNRRLHSVAVGQILADIIAEVRTQPFNVELGLLNCIVTDNQLFKPGLALDQHNFVL